MRDIINEREKTHGPYNFTAAWSQSLKDMFRGSPSWALMNDGQKEALEMIAAKLARLLNGNHNFRDHPIDIAGYAELYADSIDMTTAKVAEQMEAEIKDTVDAEAS